MSYDITNFTEYDIINENNLSIVLNHLDVNITIDIIKDIVNRRGETYNYNQLVNMIASFETFFKQIKTVYASEVDYISQVREQSYKDIINTLCTIYGLSFVQLDDTYSQAYYIYDFLIANFDNYFTDFFTQFILSEKNSLYDSLHLENFRKNKDSSTMYNKKMYKNPKLAVIVSNLEYVLDSICCFDIPFETIISNVYQDKNIIQLLLSSINPIYDFFKLYYALLFKSNIRPVLITNIRFNLQRLAGDELSLIDIQ